MREIRITLFKKGKIYDPYYQKRTDALDDISQKERLKDRKKLNKMFGIKEQDETERDR